jgi:hypothetical protein
MSGLDRHVHLIHQLQKAMPPAVQANVDQNTARLRDLADAAEVTLDAEGLRAGIVTLAAVIDLIFHSGETPIVAIGLVQGAVAALLDEHL